MYASAPVFVVVFFVLFFYILRVTHNKARFPGVPDEPLKVRVTMPNLKTEEKY